MFRNGDSGGGGDSCWGRGGRFGRFAASLGVGGLLNDYDVIQFHAITKGVGPIIALVLLIAIILVVASLAVTATQGTLGCFWPVAIGAHKVGASGAGFDNILLIIANIELVTVGFVGLHSVSSTLGLVGGRCHLSCDLPSLILESVGTLQLVVVGRLGVQKAELAVDCLEERIGLTGTIILEVVEVEGPNHGATETHLLHVVGLVPNSVNVVKADPLVALVRVRSHSVQRIPDDSPPIILHLLANLYKRMKLEFAFTVISFFCGTS